MANFCSRCGKPLADGATCSCSGQASGVNTDSVKGFWESMKNRMGIGDPERNKGDAYEKGKRIIPDCVNANEGEIPVKQYEVATLRNRILGIPYTKAIGRMQVTNKRVIFRAPGSSIAGRTTLQHEFAIDELAGVEARREYVFSFWDLLIGLIVAAIGGGIFNLLVGGIFKAVPAQIVFAFILGIAGCVPFFMLNKKWLLKLLCLGGSTMLMSSIGNSARMYGQYMDKGAASFFGGVLVFLSIISAVLMLINLIVYAIQPNLVLVIKTKGATEAIDIKRKKTGFLFFGAKDSKEEHTGYAEVIPADDAERCIREINAMVNDIQKLGDFGIEKWKK